MNKDCFIEVDYFQEQKHGQAVAGDVFLSQKIKSENRIISVLSDGLGSGIKANVLATLTATMANTYVSNFVDVKKTAELIMRTLPICKERKISYSTFTIIDIENQGDVRIIEYGNPPFILIRNGKVLHFDKTPLKVTISQYRNDALNYYHFRLQKGDRIVAFSDGISQSGMGSDRFPLGWTTSGVQEFVQELVATNSNISARELSQKICQRSKLNDGFKCKDDTTCAAIYFRKPRKLMVLTGPPVNPEKDHEMAGLIDQFDGKKVVCGGTTAKIVSRELDRQIEVNLDYLNPKVPPFSTMAGFDLITEGIITIGKVAQLLEEGIKPVESKTNAVSKFVNLLLDSDVIHFVVGTKINEVHQDPNMPVELEIRRNIIKKIAKLLEEKYLKETHLQYI